LLARKLPVREGEKMMRRALTLLGVVVVGVGTLGCSPAETSASGSVRVAFILPNGNDLTWLFYSIQSAGGVTLTSGGIDVSASTTDPSFTIALLPATGDLLNIVAVTSDNLTCTPTTATFDVSSGQTTPVQVALTCPARPGVRPGVVGISVAAGDANNCPNITSAVAAPSQTAVSDTIPVSATASDPDASDILAFHWSPAGNFDHPASAQAVFHCFQSGPQTVTLTVNDNHPIGPCAATVALTVVCMVNPPPPENDPTCQPIVNAGSDTGFDQCSGQLLRRRVAVSCPGPTIDPSLACPPPFAGNGCLSDADCSNNSGDPRNMCMAVRHLASGFCGCDSGCLQDSDCPAGTICNCSNLGLGSCDAARCTSDASCGPGLECLTALEASTANVCSVGLPRTFGCTSAADQCRADADCGTAFGAACLLVGDHRVCSTGFCPPP
jgi:hypothetical protein